MSEGRLYLQHRRLLNRFYQGMVRRHGNGAQLVLRLRAVMERVERGEVPEEEQGFLKTIQPRKARDESPLNEMQSLRITSSSSKNTLEVSRRLDVSRSKGSKRSDSSRERQEGESRFFGAEWVYTSNEQTRVFVFALLASYILTDNSVGFFMLEDRVNEELDKTQAIPPILMISINKYWQRVVEVVTKKRSYLWEKHLREPIDRMPLEFNKLIARIVAGKDLLGGAFTKDEAVKLAKEGRVAISHFTLNCREIERVQREGTGSEIIIGYLRHRKAYVIANKLPEYSQAELAHRKARTFLQQGLRSLLAEYHQDEKELALLEDSAPNDKEKTVKDFLSKKLAALKTP